MRPYLDDDSDDKIHPMCVAALNLLDVMLEPLNIQVGAGQGGTGTVVQRG